MNQIETEVGTKNDRQIYLGNKGLIAYLAIMNMFVPLSTDMYLPALPQMNDYFSSNSAITNMTLSAFLFFMHLGYCCGAP